jgi:hypothetical protein
MDSGRSGRTDVGDAHRGADIVYGIWHLTFFALAGNGKQVHEDLSWGSSNRTECGRSAGYQ